ncbi:MAG: D-glycero-beta-D-manno-heptose-1,7-bisphosphate 7-phosphatase [Chloroflexi bacterium]|nr:MAG: D-glycero-beta-D-manno-heptose-1,7-bisphosphate 7-phosphatase [Anaerolineaceae bacterium 4572_32.2]RLC77437.1 MAG: D-glycero-beta-D-manno-heptose-1,7-bisphosphate 7-phosphatase [Chloroflexota bacterium]RLC78641.1 MAG: D-glycero-beta-D-manno-heptose-1,7-bisphosphate 7-phosphatase [Chloroflexota bacterium]
MPVILNAQMLLRSFTRRAVFIDRDGVICRNRDDYVKSWEEFVFLPGALEALAQLARTDLYIVIVTNQSPINRGIVSAETVEEINSRMVLAIEAAGGRVDRVMYCPHRPDEHCACRKPQAGMLLLAAKDFGLDLSHSYLIGDAETDMQAGRAVGCRRYLVLTGRGWRQLMHSLTCGKLDFVVKWNLKAATNVIVRQESGVEWAHSQFAFG